MIFDDDVGFWSTSGEWLQQIRRYDNAKSEIGLRDTEKCFWNILDVSKNAIPVALMQFGIVVIPIKKLVISGFSRIFKDFRGFIKDLEAF